MCTRNIFYNNTNTHTCVLMYSIIDAIIYLYVIYQQMYLENAYTGRNVEAYIYVHIYIHTYIHTHIHAYVYRNVKINTKKLLKLKQ